MQAIQASFVVAVELPVTHTASHEASRTFILATKTFHLHIQSVAAGAKTTFIDSENITHYTEPPLRAAYNGVFLDIAAMRMYLALYSHQHPVPYELEAKNVNSTAMLAESRLALTAGAHGPSCDEWDHGHSSKLLHVSFTPRNLQDDIWMVFASLYTTLY